MKLTRPQRRWIFGWALIALAIASWLIFADKPWGAVAEEIRKWNEADRKLRTRHYAGQTLWWTGLALCLFAVVAAVTFRCWTKPIAAISRGFHSWKKPKWLVWLGLIFIVGIGLALRLPLASKSLWWDEMWNAKSTVVGYYLGKPDEKIEDRRFGTATMERSMWLYSKPTSHAVASVPARLSHLALSDVVHPGRQPHEFRDWVVRLPTLLVSLACIALIGVLGFRFGNSVTGLTAAFLLAIHPWHVKLGLEVRAYSWLLLWSLLGVVLLTLIFRKNRPPRWRYFFAFAIVQALIVWSFPYAAFLAGGFFLSGLALIFHAWPEWKNRRPALLRFAFANTLATLLFAHLFGPNLLQMLGWYDTVTGNHEDHSLTLSWLAHTARALTMAGENQFGFGWVVLVFALASAIWGSLLLWKNPDRRAVLFTIGGIIIGALATLAYFKMSGAYFYPRFLFFAIGPVILLAAIAWGHFKNQTVLPVVACILFLTTASPRLATLREFPIEPLRDVAQFLETEAEKNPIPVGYGHSTEYLNVYFPTARKPIISKAELEKTIAEAKASNRPLFVILGREHYNRTQMPDGFELLDDPVHFTKRAQFFGTEFDFDYQIFQWNG